MNVLHLTLSFLPGGRRKAILALAEQMKEKNVRSDLVCLDELGCPPSDIDGIVGSFQVLGRRSAFDLPALRRLARFCRCRGIDLIHTHDAASQFAAALVRLREPRYKLLMTFHRSLDFESATFRDRARNAFANLFCGAVVAGSRARHQHYLSENYVRHEKVIRIPFGVDTGRFRPDPTAGSTIRCELGIGTDTLVIGAVGHFGPEKGIDQVLRSFQLLTARPLPSPVVLVVLGTGSEAQQQSLHALLATTPSARVILAGFHSDVHRWLQGFDLFVHAPRQEAFGLVLPEAMATRLAVVATRVGGITDIVCDSLTGLTVAPGAVEDLANAMHRLVCDRSLRDCLALNAYRVAVTEYCAERFADRYLDVYRALLDGRPPQGVDRAGETGPDDLRPQAAAPNPRHSTSQVTGSNELAPQP